MPVACSATIVSSQAAQAGGITAGFALAFTTAALVAVGGGAAAMCSTRSGTERTGDYVIPLLASSLG